MPRHKHFWLSTLAVVLAFACTAPIAQPQDKPNPVGVEAVLGTWNLAVQMRNRKLEPTVVISKDGDGPKGAYSTPGEKTLKDVKFESGELSFQAIHGDRNVLFSYKGKPSGNSIKGPVSVTFSDKSPGPLFSFVGTREE
jgi:hypothetical protein